MKKLIPPNSSFSLKDCEIVLISVVRNEIIRLPSFLRHYRSIGVDRFLIIDNMSMDGSSSYLEAQSDVSLFVAPGSYGQASCGHDWVREVLELTVGKWCIVADADEYFVYPDHLHINLRQFARRLESRGETAICSYLLDMYSPFSFERNFLAENQHPIDVCSFHDEIVRHTSPDVNALCGLFPNQHRGGMRKRVFGVNACLNKISFFKNLMGTNLFQGAHYVDGAILSQIPSVTLHFKYLQEFRQYTLTESERGEHFHGAIEYKAYSKKLGEAPTLSSYHTGAQQLVCFDKFFQNMSAQNSMLAQARTPSLLDLDMKLVSPSALLSYSIKNAAHTVLCELGEAQLFQTLLSDMCMPQRSIVICAVGEKRSMWISIAKELGFEIIEIPAIGPIALPSRDDAQFSQRIVSPIVVIEAVAKWDGTMHFVDILVSELNAMLGPGATFLVDVSYAVPYHRFDHIAPDVECFFGRMPQFRSNDDPLTFVSWKKLCVAKQSSLSVVGSTTLPCQDEQHLEKLCLGGAVVASATRAAVVEWGIELVEKFKVTNSFTAVRLNRPASSSRLVQLGVELAPSDARIAVIHHYLDMPEVVLERLSAIANAFGVEHPTLNGAQRALLNAGQSLAMSYFDHTARCELELSDCSLISE
ncbi:MAG: glycosyltransferase family 2 protein [Burkholderiaceae bacterium]|nr:glycosyltransferase family 2 protein [Burkholderiaceae bacterium]MBY0243550.1 glycosyltransferase family 2 protein [Burkholderiaceae bacterium]